jgi:DnaJ-class molecular chaperone
MSYIEELFGNATPEQIAQDEANKAFFARKDAERAAAKTSKSAAVNCPKCMGSGRISSFQHIKGGECFSCGGSGLFTRF